MKTATSTLTQREREVAVLVGQGLTNRQIAAKLFISERTAEYHVEQIRNKLGFHARSQIAAWIATDVPGQLPDETAPLSASAHAPEPRPRLRPMRRTLLIGLAGAVLLAGSGVAIALSRSSPPPAMSVNRIIQLGVTSDRPAPGVIPLPAPASNLAVGEGAMWAVSYGDRVLTRIDTKSATAVGSYGIPAPPVGIAVGAGQVWIATAFGDNALEVFDPKTNQLGQPVPLGSELALQGIAYGWSSVWVTDKNNDVVYRVDPSTSTVTSRISVGDSPEGIAVDAAGVWVANAVDATVSRIDPSSSRVVATIGLREMPTAIAAGPSGVWVVSEAANLVVRIDPATNLHFEIRIDAHPSGVAVTRDAVWVADAGSGRVFKIDPGNGRILSTVSLDGRIDGMTAESQSVWVTVHGG